jgi:FAD/FMN-containing dehydrogenase
MRGVTVDPATRRAQANGGALLGELDEAAQAHGLVCPVGVVSHTGVAGLTLGGGMGRLQRRFGLTIDSLRRIELVTADGRHEAASDSENADLFWAIRGAGANFGVVTSFELELHEFGSEQTIGAFVFPAVEGPGVWAAFREFAADAPDEIHAAFSFARALPEDAYPAAVAGDPIVTIRVAHSGDPASAERDLAQVRLFGSVATESVSRERYLEVQRTLDDELAWAHRTYFKGGFTNDLPADAVKALLDHVAGASAGDNFGMWVQGGALGRVPEDATAFTGRTAKFEMSAESTWVDPGEDDRRIAWARGAFAIAEPYAATGRYVNDVMESGGDLARSIYGDAKFGRLRALKRAWDPDNVFHLNQNIAP